MYSYDLVLAAGGSLLVSSYVPVPPCSHRQCYRWVARKTGMMSPWGSRRYACAPEHVVLWLEMQLDWETISPVNRAREERQVRLCVDGIVRRGVLMRSVAQS